MLKIQNDLPVDTIITHIIQNKLNIPEYRLRRIMEYLNMASVDMKSPCDILKEMSINFKGNEKYFSIYVIGRNFSHYIEKFDENKKIVFFYFMIKKCFELTDEKLINLADIISDLSVEEMDQKLLPSDTLLKLIDMQIEDKEKESLIFIFSLFLI